MNITKLKKYLSRTPYEIELEDVKPTYGDDQGCITLYIHDDEMQFTASNGQTLKSPYWGSVKSSRKEAIQDLIERLEFGFEPILN